MYTAFLAQMVSHSHNVIYLIEMLIKTHNGYVLLFLLVAYFQVLNVFDYQYAFNSY